MTSRTQLTLFVPAEQAAGIESHRRVLDPIQFNLIAAHVTFAREDELALVDAELLCKRLEGLHGEALSLTFGPAQYFDGHGVLLPCIAGEEQFQALRTKVLGSGVLRRQRPHITLAHPRNPAAPSNNPAEIKQVARHTVADFTSICRIRQESGAQWKTLTEYALRGHTFSNA